MDTPGVSQPVSIAPESSQTAQSYIDSQLQLEQEAREVLCYQFDTCTKPLGPLRQSVFACLTCTPPPASPYQQFTPAGICYSCSISCHGEHTLVELFTKRDFECDCGTTRLELSGMPCALRHNTATGRKGGVVGEPARDGNKYNHNYEGKFCGCGEEYDPEKEKGTMFQCLGLGTVVDGGCGEDWWHPECLMGLPRSDPVEAPQQLEMNGALETVREEAVTEVGAAPAADSEAQNDTEPPLPPGFPAEDDFDHLICYQCVDAFPWIKQYAGAPGFLPAVPTKSVTTTNGFAHTTSNASTSASEETQSRKRKPDDDVSDSQDSKRVKADIETSALPVVAAEPVTNGHSHDETVATPRHATLAPAPTGRITLFLKDNFRDTLCRCSACFPRLAQHRQLLEEEESYEPPLSDSDAASQNGGAPASTTGRSVHSGGSLLERGEAALSSMDRVRAIEGVMAYNHVKDKVKAFLQPFAQSGQPVGAEEIREYFAKLRGDEAAEREAATAAAMGR
ncbi:hypothetical protein LTR91_001014 [Friedmanniomyces endolithicus]|uniref:UBR-type domain-containing protein n=1 Tax=Friedmanniomyces endolithicus TaxID=329885 RepID=A0A4U0V6I9_9PEZI|nr:hypothetical protein LTS09_009839 [Friedmanniomyces endolithicus]KAK0271123.1 hypothetical protein LTR35_013684 [Friedmanniomyces endolithicus]KAK0277610.1 hypothetical protein LTS00_014101 [Friedmanniomyces endolithicus]KAK0307487.1 hypothetical protein LTR01_005487 [Friedmanniomyces endolithicus]KAK0314310.1 hypothetical protein LTR82_013027 [Friedmanniomyces endolithicus]